MIEDCPETDIEFDALGLTIDHKHRSAECYCSRVTLDDLLSDGLKAIILREQPDQGRTIIEK